MCDKKHANKHQVKEDQTHMPLPPEGGNIYIYIVKLHYITYLHYLTVTLLNNSVELSSNLDKPVP